jgi:hypothetical protein
MEEVRGRVKRIEIMDDSALLVIQALFSISVPKSSLRHIKNEDEIAVLRTNDHDPASYRLRRTPVSNMTLNRRRRGLERDAEQVRKIRLKRGNPPCPVQDTVKTTPIYEQEQKQEQ